MLHHFNLIDCFDEIVTSSIFIPAYAHFPSALADRILADCTENLPDLSRTCIFIPNALAAHQLRKSLVKQTPALIGPYIGPMRDWINDHIALVDSQYSLVNQQARQLI